MDLAGAAHLELVSGVAQLRPQDAMLEAIAHSRIEECGRCSARREPVTRDEHGRPVCANCFITDPANIETCLHCGRRRLVGRRTPAGGDQLDLRGHHRVRYLLGHRPAVVSDLSASPGGLLEMRAAHPPIISGTLDQPLCAECTAPPAWLSCPICSGPNHPHLGQCGRCLINRRLDEVMGPDTAALPPGLHALRSNIATAEHHITAMRWLTKPAIAPVLADLAAGRMPLGCCGPRSCPRSRSGSCGT